VGARNVAAAYAMYPRLPHRAMRLLAYMALRSLDDDRPEAPARRYFGGRDEMAEALGYDLSTDARREAARREVRRTVAQLRAAGALGRLASGRAGNRSVYQLRLELLSPRRGVDDPLQEGRGRPPQEGSGRPPQGGPPAPPKEYGGTTEENDPGQLTSGSSSHLTRATTTANPDDVDEFERNRAALLAAGDDHWQRALESAHQALPEASMRERIAYARRELQREVARA